MHRVRESFHNPNHGETVVNDEECEEETTTAVTSKG